MKEHPHAELLHAIADGEPLQGWECNCKHSGWTSLGGVDALITHPEAYEVRRARRKKFINGCWFTEPFSQQRKPKEGQAIHLAYDLIDDVPTRYWGESNKFLQKYLDRELVFASKEEALRYERAVRAAMEMAKYKEEL